MNDHAQEEAKGIDEDVALAPFDLLARIVTREIERRPPFTVSLRRGPPFRGPAGRTTLRFSLAVR